MAIYLTPMVITSIVHFEQSAKQWVNYGRRSNP
jgi:hypothetical protein